MGSAPHTVITRGEWLGHGVKQHHLMRAKIEDLNSVLFCYLSTWQILEINIRCTDPPVGEVCLKPL